MVSYAGADDLPTERTLGVDRNAGVQASQTRGAENMLTRMTGVGGVIHIKTDGASVAIKISQIRRHCSESNILYIFLFFILL